MEIRHISLHTSLPPLSKPPPGVWRCRAPTHWVGRADVRRSWRRNSQWILGVLRHRNSHTIQYLMGEIMKMNGGLVPEIKSYCCNLFSDSLQTIILVG